jgi:hypothetical protein
MFSQNDQPALVRLSQAEQSLDRARNLSDVKRIIDIAEAARVYSKAAKLGELAARHAEELKLKAQRKAGRLLSKLEKSASRIGLIDCAPLFFRRSVRSGCLLRPPLIETSLGGHAERRAPSRESVGRVGGSRP